MLDYLKDIWVNHKKDIIYLIILLCVLCWALLSTQSCSNRKIDNKNLENNIVALCDSIEYYNGKNGELVAEKTILLGEIDNLKLINTEMYNDIESIKRKNASLVAQIENTIINPRVDTVWKYSKDTLFVPKAFIQEFSINNEWRTLTGNIELENNKMGLHIDKDEVYFKYTVALEDNKIYITSDNPYVKYNSVTAIAKPEKPKRWCLGFQLGVGVQYDLFSKSFGFGPSLNAGLTYEFYF